MEKSIFLAVPHYGAIVPEALVSLTMASMRHRVSLTTNGASLLAFNFNSLWGSALNQRSDKRLTHFAMHHADVGAEPGWIDILLDEMAKVGADVIATVIPIKDNRGLTSTGVQDPETLQIRRLTMTEVFRLPVTFSAAHCAQFSPPGESCVRAPAGQLMVNTGLWLCDFTKPWVEEAYFEIRDRIVAGSAGRFQANVLPEDWNFSGWCARKGLKVWATRAVKVSHHGPASYRNDTAWGEWETDLGDRR
jgi:hypothetical protein